MTSKPVAMLLADLGVTRSHSRPQVSNDNPYSESQFKTLKHHPSFPDRFGCIQDARAFCQTFFTWYNHEHRHSGIALLTPADVHYGRAERITSARAQVLEGAYAAHPQRFVRKPPQPPRLPEQVWINNPSTQRRRSAISRLTCLTKVDRLRAGVVSEQQRVVVEAASLAAAAHTKERAAALGRRLRELRQAVPGLTGGASRNRSGCARPGSRGGRTAY